MTPQLQRTGRPAYAGRAASVDPRPLRERAREALAVPGPPWVRVGVRAVGALAVISLVGALPWGVVGLSLIALVLLGVTLARVVRLPGGFQLPMGTVLLLGAWAGLLQLYQRWWWLDIVVHAVATSLLAVLVTVALARTGAFRPASAGWARAGLALITVTLGLALGAVWEVCEWVGHSYLDRAIHVGYTDTVADLTAGGLGSAVAGGFLATRRTADP